MPITVSNLPEVQTISLRVSYNPTSLRVQAAVPGVFMSQGVGLITRGVSRVMVRGHEVDRDLARLAEREELFNPSVACRRRSAYFQRRVDVLDGAGGDAIQLEVVVPGAAPECLQIRFVPHFEEPRCHFLDAVALDPMRHERVDQGRPLRVIPRGRHVAAVSEDGLGSGRERRGHEAQLDEWPHANREQEIDDLVGVEERIPERVVMVDDRSEIIRQQPVKAHVAKSQLGSAAAKLLLPVGPERGRRMAAADGVLPDVSKLGPLLRKIAPELHGFHG